MGHKKFSTQVTTTSKRGVSLFIRSLSVRVHSQFNIFCLGVQLKLSGQTFLRNFIKSPLCIILPQKKRTCPGKREFFVTISYTTIDCTVYGAATLAVISSGQEESSLWLLYFNVIYNAICWAHKAIKWSLTGRWWLYDTQTGKSVTSICLWITSQLFIYTLQFSLILQDVNSIHVQNQRWGWVASMMHLHTLQKVYLPPKSVDIVT